MGQWLFRNLPNSYPYINGNQQYGCGEAANGDIYVHDAAPYGIIRRVDRITGESVTVKENIWSNVGGPLSTASVESVGVSYINASAEEEMHFCCMRRDDNGNLHNNVLIYNITTTYLSVIQPAWSLNGRKTLESGYVRNYSNGAAYNALATYVFDNKVYYFYIQPDNNATVTVGYYDPSSRTYNNIIQDLNVSTAGVWWASILDTDPTMWIKDNIMYIVARNYYDTTARFCKLNLTTSVFTNLTSIGTIQAARYHAVPFVAGNYVYLLGGRLANDSIATNPSKYNMVTDTWSTENITNTFTFACTSIPTLGELWVQSPYTGTTVAAAQQKFTYVLNDIAGFTASYIPGETNSIRLDWADSSEESFYVIEKKIDNGDWFQLVQLPSDIITYLDSDNIDIVAHKYSYRIKAAQVVVI